MKQHPFSLVCQLSLAVILFLFLPGFCSADEEAWLLDGRRLKGRLHLTAKGWSFLTEPEKIALNLDQLERVVFLPTDSPRFDCPPHRLVLSKHQSLSGELLGVDEKNLQFRTFWGQRLDLPRSAVMGVTHKLGWLTLFREDFEKDLQRWQVSGAPTLSAKQAHTGKQSLGLDGAGQKASLHLPTPLSEGRIDLFFFDPGTQKPWQHQVELEFAAVKETFILRLQLDRQGYHLLTPLPSARLRSSRGWHHVQVDFFKGKNSLVSVDERLLWEGRLPPTPLPLPPFARGGWGGVRKIVLLSLQGPVWFDNVHLWQVLAQQPRLGNYLEQDELWLASGDQLFGRLLNGDSQQVQFQTRSNPRPFNWEQLRGIFFRQGMPGPIRTEGEHVQLWLRSQADAPLDEIHGTLQGLDEKLLLLHHPQLGVLPIDRHCLVRLRGWFRGQRLELAHKPIVLGPKGQLLPGRFPLPSQGPSWKQTFPLGEIPANAQLVVQATQVPGLREGVASSKAGAALCTAVLLNDTLVGHLNDHVQHASPHSQEIRLAIRPEVFRRGDNILEFRQVAEAKTGAISRCGITSVVLEIPTNGKP